MLSLKQIEKDYKELEKEIIKAQKEQNWQKVGELSKKKERLEEILEGYKELQEIENKLKEAQDIIKTEHDPELLAVAQEEVNFLRKEVERKKAELEKLLRKDKKEPKAIIVEIRAGAGGEEAALFAADLFSMYSKYAQKNGWKLRILDELKTDLGGYKYIIFELEGKDVYSKMKYEGGVHRVQRIPITEKSGRIHTSTASVAILPKVEESEIEIKPEDLKIETFRASGPGGQYVNKRESAVRITHLPTGIVVSCQSMRTQNENKKMAMAILRAKLLEEKLKKEEQQLQQKRRAQIGRMERSEKIRTYNFPQDRITDHRIKKSWHNIEEILAGNLEPIIQELEANLQNS